MALICCIGNLGSLHVFFILLSQDVNFRAIIASDEPALIFVFFQDHIIFEKHYDCSLALYTLFSVLCSETLFDPMIDEIEPTFLCLKYLNGHLIDIVDLIGVRLVRINLILSLVHDEDLIDETFYLVLRWTILLLFFRIHFRDVVGRWGVGF